MTLYVCNQKKRIVDNNQVEVIGEKEFENVYIEMTFNVCMTTTKL